MFPFLGTKIKDHDCIATQLFLQLVTRDSPPGKHRHSELPGGTGRHPESFTARFSSCEGELSAEGTSEASPQVVSWPDKMSQVLAAPSRSLVFF